MAAESPKKDDFFFRWFSGIGASFVAESITLPTDVIKVRLQVQSKAAETAATVSGEAGSSGVGVISPVRRYSGMLDCGRSIYRNEGAVSLWKGYVPALTRACCYNSLMMVLFEPIRNLIVAGKPCIQDNEKHLVAKPNFAQRLLAGGSAGGIAIAIFNPTEVVKTQVQAHQGAEKLRIPSVISKVWRNDGLLGFWAGVRPNVARTFLVNAAELGTYDQAKNWLIDNSGMGDGLVTHTAASGCAGFVSACVSTPADVVKTRLMNQAGGAGAGPRKGMLALGAQILREEGPSALYAGFTPICCRKLVWCAAFFVTYERIRKNLNGI